MNDMYYNDYYGAHFSYEPYPITGTNYVNRSSSSSSSSYSSSSDDRVDSFYNPAEGFAKGNMQSNIYKPYKLNNPVLPQADTERERLLLEIQMYSFAMWDLNLYLNTHPTDRNVIRMFDQYRNSYKKAKENYESRFGALHVDCVNANNGVWEWNSSPWPWEVK